MSNVRNFGKPCRPGLRHFTVLLPLLLSMSVVASAATNDFVQTKAPGHAMHVVRSKDLQPSADVDLLAQSKSDLKANSAMAESVESRKLADSLLLQIGWNKISRVDQFLDLYRGEINKSDLAGLKKLLKGMDKIPMMERKGNDLVVRDGAVIVVADISQLKQNKIAIDGVTWIIDPNSSLTPQVGLLLKKLRMKNPAKYGLLDPSDSAAYAVNSDSGNGIPGAFEIAQANLLIEEAPAVVDAVAPNLVPNITKIATQKFANSKFANNIGKTSLWIGTVVGAQAVANVFTDRFQQYRDRNCAITFHNNYSEVPADSSCFKWAQNRRESLIKRDHLIDPSSLGMTDEGARITKEFETLATKCPDKTNREFRGYIRSTDQTVWRYLVLDLDVQNGKTQFRKLTEFDRENRPYFKEDVPKDFPAIAQTNDMSNTPFETVCAPDQLENICCDMVNPNFETDRKISEKSAHKRTSRCLADLDSGSEQMPDLVQQNLKMYKDMIPYIQWVGITCGGIGLINKGIQSESGGVSASPTAPVNIVPTQAGTAAPVIAAPPKSAQPVAAPAAASGSH